jgi:hypothetical protein
MIAVRAEELLQIVVGPRQIRYLVAMEQPRPVTAGNFEEVIDCWGERACFLTVARDGT